MTEMPVYSTPLIMFFAVILLAFLAGVIIVNIKIHFLFALILGLAFIFISFLNIQYGLVTLVFSMLLSPEIPLAQLPGRSVVVRYDDFILLALFVVWLVHMAIRKEMALFVRTPINRQIFIYTFICILFTARGIVLGYIKPVKSFFYLLKYIEYFILFIMTANIVRDTRQVKHLLIAGLITFIIVNLYGYTLIGRVGRIYAPFDFDPVSGTGESASLGGYLLIVMSVLLGLFCYAPTTKYAILFMGLFIFALPTFAYTFSRASFFAFIPMCLSVVLLTQKRKLLLIMIFITGLLFSPILFPKPTQDVLGRIQETFAGTDEQTTVGGIRVREASALARVESWKKAFFVWLPREPLMGHGLTGVGLVDTMFPLILGETGIVGLLAFIWLMYSVGKNAIKIFNTIDDWLAKGLALGLFSALIALIFQSVAVNTFIIIRIMGPFWFLTAIVLRLPEIYTIRGKKL